MGTTAAILDRAKIIALDTAILIYYFENHPRFADQLETLFVSIEQGRKRAIISAITLHEILIKPLRLGRIDLAAMYKRELTEAEHLAALPVTVAIAEIGADLRARHTSLLAPDALQLATAIAAGAEVFLTADRRLAHIPDVSVVVLSESRP